MLFKVRNKKSEKIYRVFDVRYNHRRQDNDVNCSEKEKFMSKYTEFFIYDEDLECFRWDFVNGYEPIE